MKTNVVGSNNRESSQPASSSSSKPLETSANLPSQVRSLSGSKFNASYTQQLKKQVQVSSQANNIDPLSTK